MGTEPWWQRIRGPRAISWQSVIFGDLLISIAIVASGGTLGGYTPGPNAQSLAFFAISAASVLAALWALIGFRVLFRDRHLRPVSLGVYVLFYAVNGGIYFLTVQWLESQSEFSSAIGWPARLVSSVAISLAWAIAISLLLDSSDRFRTQRQVLLDDMVAAETRRLRESREVLRLREALDAQVDEVLASTRSRLNQALVLSGGGSRPVGPDDVGAAVAVVRTAANDVVRPLSHKLLEQAQASFPAPRLTGVLRQWWDYPRMPPLATALLVSAQTSAESVRNFGGIWGPIAGLTYFGLLYAFLLMIDRASKRFPTWIRPIYALGVVGSLTMNLMYSEGFSPDGFDSGDAFANAVVSVIYIVVTSLADALRRAREGLLESLESQITAEELRARALEGETAAVVDAVARELHGRVQTQLVVCAAELERASLVDDHESVMRALYEASEALETATQPRSPELNHVVSAWDSLMTVDVNVEEVPQSELTRPDVIAVIEEALANSYRHGHATHVSITLQCTADALRIVVIDNGQGVVGSAAGMGTSLLRQLSGDRAFIENGSEGAILTVDLNHCSYQ